MDATISKKQKSINDIPQELLECIFHRLPVKSIGRCMCVRKQWLSIIKNPIFIPSNANFKRESNQFTIFWRSPRRDLEIYIDSDDKFEFYKYLMLPHDIYDHNAAAVGSCHGLLCIGKCDGTILLWNPTIRKMLTLPKPDDAIIIPYRQYLGFTFQSLTADYKLVRISYGRVDIFSLRSYSWKIVSQTAPGYQFSGPSLSIQNINALHWLCLNRSRIVSFNMNTEVFQEIKLPKYLEHRVSRLKLTSVYEQSSIAVSYNNNLEDDTSLEIWVMKEYGNVESWSKIWKYNRDMYFLPGRSFYGSIIGIRYKGEVLWRVVVSDVSNKDMDQQPLYKTLALSVDLKNAEKIHHVEIVKSMPLFGCSNPNQWIWIDDVKGIYRVKSGYIVALDLLNVIRTLRLFTGLKYGALTFLLMLIFFTGISAMPQRIP